LPNVDEGKSMSDLNQRHARNHISRIDLVRSECIDKALSLQMFAKTKAAVNFLMAAHFDNRTVFRVLRTKNHRPVRACLSLPRPDSQDARLDEALRLSFPASDPVAISIA
jgi:hypothetical protein